MSGRSKTPERALFLGQRSTTHLSNGGPMSFHIEKINILSDLYGYSPSFNQICLHQLTINWNGPIVQLKFDLHEFPSKPPAKWGAFNTIQVDLSIFPLSLIRVEKFGEGNICNIAIDKVRDNLFEINVTGDSIADIHGSHIRIEKLSAYLNNP
ncbi:Imm50 family immunity protein [Pseudacidovorax intermedius]|uniref:Imm50 family immunity protein n=1 Tax=Pseudacidovorax intermedius TaxID=433924 RepID=UPI000E0B63FA